MNEDRKEHTHPSWGVAMVNRTSVATRDGGGVNLFRSQLLHHSMISLTISRARVFTDGSEPMGRLHDGERLIQVHFSALQFADLLTQQGVMPGVPCTISRYNREMVPEPPPEVFVIDAYEQDAEKHFDEVEVAGTRITQTARRILDKKTIGKKDFEEFVGTVDRFVTSVAKNLPFVKTRFRESMRTVVTEAAAEASSMIDGLIRAAGLESVQEHVRRVLPSLDAHDNALPSLPAPEGAADEMIPLDMPDRPENTPIHEAGPRELAERISRHLRRLENAQPKKSKDSGGGLYCANASTNGRTVGVVYVSYQGHSDLDVDLARRFLTALDAGYRGRHYPEALALWEAGRR